MLLFMLPMLLQPMLLLWLPAPPPQDPEEHPVADIAQLGRPYGQELAQEQWPAALVGPGQRLLQLPLLPLLLLLPQAAPAAAIQAAAIWCGVPGIACIDAMINSSLLHATLPPAGPAGRAGALLPLLLWPAGAAPPAAAPLLPLSDGHHRQALGPACKWIPCSGGREVCFATARGVITQVAPCCCQPLTASIPRLLPAVQMRTCWPRSCEQGCSSPATSWSGAAAVQKHCCHGVRQAVR